MNTRIESSRAHRVGYVIGSALGVALAGAAIGVCLGLVILAALSLLRAVT